MISAGLLDLAAASVGAVDLVGISLGATEVWSSGPSALVRDSFNRPDSTSSPGSTQTGQAWRADGGTWGISGNQAYRSDGGDGNLLTVPTGVSDMVVAATVTNRDGGHQGIIARGSEDLLDLYLLDASEAAWRLFKRTGGGFAQLGGGTPATPFSRMELSVVGSTLKVILDGVQVFTMRDTSITAGTRAGFRYGGGSLTARFDDFEVRQPAPRVWDSFNRTDSATLLGSTETGQAWTALSGLWGISGNSAYEVNNTGQAITVVETGVSDCTVSATLLAIQDTGLCFRVTDNDNNFVTNPSGLFRKQFGAYTHIGSFPSINSGDRLAVVLSGSTITVKVNGTAVLSVTDTFNQTATKHGLRAHNSPLARFDDFEVTV